jgi:copper chaperone CopZ
LCFSFSTSSEGVKKVDANLTTKKVDVECEDEVDSSKLMEALKKWSGSSGKSVEEWN